MPLWVGAGGHRRTAPSGASKLNAGSKNRARTSPKLAPDQPAMDSHSSISFSADVTVDPSGGGSELVVVASTVTSSPVSSAAATESAEEHPIATISPAASSPTVLCAVVLIMLSSLSLCSTPLDR